jgi:transaldolase
MALYLDSASPAEVRRAKELGFIVGVTTNPKLLAGVSRSADQVLPELCDALGEGTVFYQLTAPSVSAREAEARRMTGLRPGCLALKIPCTTENLAMVPCLSEAGLTCAVTAVFSAHQTLLACEVGADYVIPYVNRATRQMGDGITLVEAMATVVEATGSSTEILAASFRSLSEVVRAFQAGADHVTISLDLMETLGDHPLSERAIEDFARFI